MSYSGGSGSAPLQLSRSVLLGMEEYGPDSATYPAAEHFSTRFDADDFLEAVADCRNTVGRHGLSLYLHMPWCDADFDCLACSGGNEQCHRRTSLYLRYLKREVELQSALFPDMDPIEQLYVGTAASTCPRAEQSDDLMQQLRRSFHLTADTSREYVIKIGACTASVAQIHALHAQGFNRLILSVQVFAQDSAAVIVCNVKRIQPAAKTVELIQAGQAAGFRSISVDFIYGHPYQNIISIARTLSVIIAAAPDRVVLHDYAHLSYTSGLGSSSCDTDMPGADTRLDMFHRCIRQLSAAGYVYIGMHHFAKPGDDIAIAQQQGRLYRNLQGFSIHPETDAIACGVSAIAAVGNTYSQNEKKLDAYYKKIDAGMLPIARGMHLTTDDLLRRFIIQRLACNFELSLNELEIAYPIVFKEYFAAELDVLRRMEADGWLQIKSGRIIVHPRGRLSIHVICMVFDRHQAAPACPQLDPQHSQG